MAYTIKEKHSPNGSKRDTNMMLTLCYQATAEGAYHSVSPKLDENKVYFPVLVVKTSFKQGKTHL